MKIAISGLSGCGNSTVTGLLADKLKLKKLNYTLRDVAREEGVAFDVMQNELVKKSDEYDYRIDRKQAEFAVAEENCVVSSRLAAWLDDGRILEKISAPKPRFNLKVWLSASFDERVKRIAKRENKPITQVVLETKKRDKENTERYRKLYGVDVNDYLDEVDVIINTEHFDALKVSDIVVSAAKALKKR